MPTSIPLNDLSHIHEPLLPALEQAAISVLRSGRYILGPEVEAFEAEMAALCGTTHAVGVSSGTDALLAALMAIEIEPGDEVVTTPFSFFATAGAVHRLGAVPAFADIEEGSFNLDPVAAATRVNGRTRALLPVHLFGRCADIEPLRTLIEERGLALIEDAAQAIGAIDAKGRRAGSLGTAGCFSFFPAKNLGAFGDAGLVTTSDDALAERLRVLRSHGGKPKYHHAIVGGNFRIDALQAALLRVKLPHLDAWVDQRTTNVALYRQLFAERGLEAALRMPEPGPGRHVWNQLCVSVSGRDALRQHLAVMGVATEVYYPVPLHLQPCFRYLGHGPGDFPRAERAAASLLALPIYPGLEPSAIARVADAIAAFYAGHAPG